MACPRIPMLRNLLFPRLALPRALVQKRWAQVHDVRFLATTNAARNVLDKYRDKLDAKARSEGHADADDLLKAHIVKERERERVQERERRLVDVVESTPSQDLAQNDVKTAPSVAGVSSGSTTSHTGAKSLDEIIDVDKARNLPVPELTAIWRLRHASTPTSVCAVIPSETYVVMEAEAKQHPQFILPVPHADQGAEIHFLQWTFDPSTSTSTVLFTQLAEYKARGEFAVPHTTLTHHLDLAAEKGVVLMQGTVASDRGVKVDDARWLVMSLQRFYGGWDGAKNKVSEERAAERRKLLYWFRHGDERFTVEKLLEEAERMA